MRTKIYLLAALLSIGAALSHALAVGLSLYWVFPWFDVPIHAAGGAMIGLLSYAVLSHRFSPISTLALSFSMILLVGVAWELFEYLVGTSLYEPGFVLDTAYDLIADCVGGALGLLYAKGVLTSSAA